MSLSDPRRSAAVPSLGISKSQGSQTRRDLELVGIQDYSAHKFSTASIIDTRSCYNGCHGLLSDKAL